MDTEGGHVLDLGSFLSVFPGGLVSTVNGRRGIGSACLIKLKASKANDFVLVGLGFCAEGFIVDSRSVIGDDRDEFTFL